MLSSSSYTYCVSFIKGTPTKHYRTKSAFIRRIQPGKSSERTLRWLQQTTTAETGSCILLLPNRKPRHLCHLEGWHHVYQASVYDEERIQIQKFC